MSFRISRASLSNQPNENFIYLSRRTQNPSHQMFKDQKPGTIGRSNRMGTAVFQGTRHLSFKARQNVVEDFPIRLRPHCYLIASKTREQTLLCICRGADMIVSMQFGYPISNVTSKVCRQAASVRLHFNLHLVQLRPVLQSQEKEENGNASLIFQSSQPVTTGGFT